MLARSGGVPKGKLKQRPRNNLSGFRGIVVSSPTNRSPARPYRFTGESAGPTYSPRTNPEFPPLGRAAWLANETINWNVWPKLTQPTNSIRRNSRAREPKSPQMWKPFCNRDQPFHALIVELLTVNPDKNRLLKCPPQLGNRDPRFNASASQKHATADAFQFGNHRGHILWAICRVHLHELVSL
jgi:hypothetical protein